MYGQVVGIVQTLFYVYVYMYTVHFFLNVLGETGPGKLV